MRYLEYIYYSQSRTHKYVIRTLISLGINSFAHFDEVGGIIILKGRVEVLLNFWMFVYELSGCSQILNIFWARSSLTFNQFLSENSLKTVHVSWMTKTLTGHLLVFHFQLILCYIKLFASIKVGLYSLTVLFLLSCDLNDMYMSVWPCVICVFD